MIPVPRGVPYGTLHHKNQGNQGCLGSDIFTGVRVLWHNMGGNQKIRPPESGLIVLPDNDNFWI